MRARRCRRSALFVAGVALLASLTPFSPTTADAALPGAFEGDLLCDGDFQGVGEVGDARPALDGPCWYDTTIGGSISGWPNFVDDSGNRLVEVCGYQGCGEVLLQPITVPYGITEATLSVDIYDIDSDTTPNDCDDSEQFDQVDYGVAQISGTDGSSVYFALHCEDGPSGLQTISADVTDALSSIEGQNVYVYVGGATSATDDGETFYLDNVSLLVSAQGQAMTTYARKATLALKNHIKASGRISSPDVEAWPGCWAAVTVRFDRKKGTEWVRLTKKTTTDPEGFYTVLLPDKQGKYRAVVERTPLDAAHRCAKVVSPLRAHEH